MQKTEALKIIRTNTLIDILGVSRSTINRWKQQNILPPQVTLGNHIVGWDRRDIESWIEKNKGTVKA